MVYYFLNIFINYLLDFTFICIYLWTHIKQINQINEVKLTMSGSLEFNSITNITMIGFRPTRDP